MRATTPTARRPAALPRRAVRAGPAAPRAEGGDQTPPPATTPATCAACGIALADAPRGCDGAGRVAGGLGAVLSFWPVKAYRPCPALEAAGRAYTRKGQITDEMLFGSRGKQ